MPSKDSKDFVATETIVTNPWHRYCVDQYRLRDGSLADYYHIDMTGACGIIPIFEDGSTVLLKVYRYLLNQTLWEFPIGGMQPGDAPLAVAKRELQEEAGLLAEDWQELGRFAPYKGASTEVDHFYLARDLTWTEQKLEPSESISVHPMSMSEARQQLLGQALVDGQSVVGLVLLDQYLARQDQNGS